MNKLINRVFIVLAIAGVLGISSCGEEPWDLQDDGAGGRLLASFGTGNTSGQYLLGLSPEVTWNLPIVANPGTSVSSIEVFMELTTAEFGVSDVVSVGSFTEGAEGVDITVTQAQLFSAPVGGSLRTENDLSPGDTWKFTYLMTLGSGEVLDGNESANHTVTFTCFVDDADFVGGYTLAETVSTGWAFGTAADITFVAEGSRTFTVSWFGFDDRATFDLDFVCGAVLLTNVNGSGLACGGGDGSEITFSPNATNGVYDPSDDSSFTISLQIDDQTSGCGWPAEDVILTMTKN